MAVIRLDLQRTLGRVDRRIFGGFIEHLGRCIYGGVYEPGSPLADAYGFRTDVLEALRGLKTPILRWPGGNFVSGYHWPDGIGPLDARPRRQELAWGAEEPNTFGTDEFIAYCQALRAEPYICINMGSGSLDEAQAWVEYCNGTGNTHWANLRRANGHPEPYGVRYWGLGNEMWGAWQIGAMSADEYARAARRYGAIMRKTDPSIELVSCGQWGFTDWDRVVIEELADLVRYHSIHLYTGSVDYARNVFMPHQADYAIRQCAALIERVRRARHISQPLGIAFDEWNVWYRTHDEVGRLSGLEERYDLADALAVATFLNVFIRHCRSVEIANLAQMVNVIAPIFTNERGLFLQTIYHPLRLYAEHSHQVALDPTVVCDRVSLPADYPPPPRPDQVLSIADLGPFGVLDVSATRDESCQNVTLAVVNRHRTDAVQTIIEVPGQRLAGGMVYAVQGGSPSATNSFEQPAAVRIEQRPLDATHEPELRFSCAPHSVNVLTLRFASGEISAAQRR